MVSSAKASAGLKPGQNLSTPNQKKTIPMLMRSSVMP